MAEGPKGNDAKVVVAENVSDVSAKANIHTGIRIPEPEFKSHLIEVKVGTRETSGFPKVEGRIIRLGAEFEPPAPDTVVDAVELDIGDEKLPPIEYEESKRQRLIIFYHYFQVPPSAKSGRRLVQLIVWVDGVAWGSVNKLPVTVPPK